MALVLFLARPATGDLSGVVSLALLVAGGGASYVIVALVVGAVPRHLLRR